MPDFQNYPAELAGTLLLASSGNPHQEVAMPRRGVPVRAEGMEELDARATSMPCVAALPGGAEGGAPYHLRDER